MRWAFCVEPPARRSRRGFPATWHCKRRSSFGKRILSRSISPPGGKSRRLGFSTRSSSALSGTLTRRAGTGIWTEMSPGVTYTILFDDPVTKRRSMLVRALPGATYETHFHDEGHEECLILEGDLVMGDLKLLAGDFHLAAKGSSHPPATTVSGCLLHISTAL